MATTEILTAVSVSGETVVLRIEIEQEGDSHWIAEFPALPGVMSYGDTGETAQAKVEALALWALADRLEHGEAMPDL